MAVYKADILDIELNTGNIARSFLCHNIGKDDTKADRFGVRVYRDGEPESLSGCSIQGYMMRPNGTNLAITGSNTGVSGNEAWVDLPQAAYDYEGQFCLALKLIGGGVTGTVRIIDGMINNTFVSDAVAPTAAVPTYQEVLSVYDQMVAAKAGSVRFDTDQSLTAAQMIQARGNIEAASESDVNDLKSAFDSISAEISEFEDNGLGLLSRGNFQRNLYNPQRDEVLTGYLYRVSARKVMQFPRPLTLHIANGFRVYPWIYSNSTWSTPGFVTGTYSIPTAGTQFLMYIARVTEDTNEIADVAEFVKQVTISIPFLNTINGRISTNESSITSLGVKDTTLLNEITEYENTGKTLLTRGNFDRGQYNPSTEVLSSEYTYRISSRTAMLYPCSVIITPASGFRIYPWLYASNGWTTAGWKTEAFNVAPNTPIMVYIARVTENTSEEANIAEFLQAVTVAMIKTNDGFNSNVLTVGTGRQYETIQAAVNASIDGDIIVVYPGTYSESVQNIAQKYISIIGIDRDQCIITYSGWDYDNPPLNMGRGTIKNLTIHATDTGEQTEHTAYALHVDTGASIGTLAAPQSFYAENCRFIDDVRQPVGIGLKRYFTCEFFKCIFESTNGYPAFYAHTWEVSSGVTNLVGQRLVLKNCSFINSSNSGNPTIQMQSQEWPNTDAVVLYQHNVVINEGGGDTIGMHIYRDNGGSRDKFMGSSDWTLSPLSYGNNVATMNAN